MECLFRFGGTPVGYAKVAREAGMANNTVANGYIEQLTELLEVKRGKRGPLEFGWFPKVFPKAHLTVISASRFETDAVEGITLPDFLSRQTD